MEPILKEARVNRPEIGVVLEVALIQIRETRVFAVEAGLHGIADQKHLRRRTVVGAEAAVLLRGTAEFREGGGQRAVALSVASQVTLTPVQVS